MRFGGFCFFFLLVFPFSRTLEMQKLHPEMKAFLVLGSGEANWEGNVVAGVWRRRISQTDFVSFVN